MNGLEADLKFSLLPSHSTKVLGLVSSSVRLVAPDSPPLI